MSQSYSFERSDIEFNSTDGVTLRGWYYKPETDAPCPAIAMSHGFTALKEHKLDKFAERFAAAGFIVLVWDNRNFGDSDGSPRQHIDVILQRRDYRDALTFLSLQDDVDENRMGIWGSSLSGSNVLAVAGQDRRVKAVVSQVPGSQCWPQRNQYMLPIETAANLLERENDRKARMQGGEFKTMKVVDTEAGNGVFWNDARSAEFFELSDKWINAVTIASSDTIEEYDVYDLADKICPTPLLLIAATEDQLVPVVTMLKTYEKALETKKLMVLKGDHFCAYYEDEAFFTASDAAIEWFLEHL